ncbi:unannotated protein [freshwater metagenome]|uniref:Unannotated protein n=1 Tax=freshwater metagenome TaxID=449393 RepID=A0A6J7GZF2_9ZZZZ|nr:phage terminase large subunit [Actinomycetota bacterium]
MTVLDQRTPEQLEREAELEEIAALEAEARELDGLPPLRYRDPAELACAFDPKYRVPPHLALVFEAYMTAIRSRAGRLIITMPPQEGKSVAVSKWGNLWALLDNPNRRLAEVSYADELATRWTRDVRNTIQRWTELGLGIDPTQGINKDWKLDGFDGGMIASSLPGGSFTGRAVDVMVIDDPIKGPADASSDAFQKAMWDWWTTVAVPRLGPESCVIVIQTRWHERDLAGRLITEDDEREERGEPRLWTVLRIPAQADHRPEEGERDPLGRDPGEYLPSARGRTPEDWETIKRSVGARSWNALYQGRPSPDEGQLFKRAAWRYYSEPLWEDTGGVRRVRMRPGDVLVASWDMTFKDTKSSDYVVGQVWLRRGADAYLLDQVRGRMAFTATQAAVKALHARWPQALPILVESAANGEAVMNSLKRTVPGLVGVTAKESKYARAVSISPLQESQNLWLPAKALAPWVGDLIDEAASFPNGAHDDQVDALSQGLRRLFLQQAGPSTTSVPQGVIARSAPGQAGAYRAGRR